jgi:hypothetical protein
MHGWFKAITVSGTAVRWRVRVHPTNVCFRGNSDRPSAFDPKRTLALPERSAKPLRCLVPEPWGGS